jgi:hypothetical protein
VAYLALPYFFTLCHKGRNFREKKSLNIKYVFWFSLQRLSGTLLVLRKIKRVLNKSSNIEFHENPSSGSQVVPCGQTDGRTNRLTVTFYNFENAPNKSSKRDSNNFENLSKINNNLQYSDQQNAQYCFQIFYITIPLWKLLQVLIPNGSSTGNQIRTTPHKTNNLSIK